MKHTLAWALFYPFLTRTRMQNSKTALPNPVAALRFELKASLNLDSKLFQAQEE